MQNTKIIQEAIASLEWAAKTIGDIPPDSHYMMVIANLKILLEQLNLNEPE